MQFKRPGIGLKIEVGQLRRIIVGDIRPRNDAVFVRVVGHAIINFRLSLIVLREEATLIRYRSRKLMFFRQFQELVQREGCRTARQNTIDPNFIKFDFVDLLVDRSRNPFTLQRDTKRSMKLVLVKGVIERLRRVNQSLSVHKNPTRIEHWRW